MPKKPRRKRKSQSPASRQKPWLWLAVGGALLLIVGGLGLVWAMPGAGGPAAVPAGEGGTPRLEVDQIVVDEGDVKIDTMVRTSFRLTNAGDAPLQILGEPQVQLVEGC